MYVYNNADVMKKIISAPKQLLAIGLITNAFTIMLGGFLDITCAKVYDVEIKFSDATIFSFIATAANTVFPLQMGSAFKATYYKKKLNLGYSRFVSIVSGTIIIGLIINIIEVIICLVYLQIKRNNNSSGILFLSLLLVVTLLGIFLCLKYKEAILHYLPFKKYSYTLVDGFFELMSDKRAVLLCSINYIVNLVMGGLRFMSIFEILNIQSDVMDGMLYYGFYRATFVIPIIPGNIGISEAIMGGMNTILGSDFETGVIITLIDRLMFYLVAIVGAILGAIPGLIRYSNARNAKLK